jgi:putative ABC transport system ATP-binding protein
MTEAAMIDIRGLTKTFHTGEVEVHALRGVDLSVARGEFVAVAGPSGSGKSTLFHILGGLTPPTSGSIHIGGRDLLSMTDAERTELRKNGVGFVFQKYNLLPTLTASENIEIARDIAGRRGKPRSQHFEEIVKLLGIAGRMDHKPKALSGGEQQRVAIARAIVNEPALLLADEPTGNLDPRTSGGVFDALIAITRAEGLAALIATHNFELAARMDRALLLHQGRLVAGTDLARA